MAYTPPNPNGQAAMAASAPVVIASNQTAVPVSGTFWQATQPISGTVTANIGTIAGLATETTVSAMSGKLPATIGQKAMAASLAVVIASDQSTVPVSLASVPTHAVTQSGTWNIGAVTSLTQMNGQAISMGTGARDAGTQRVTIATNDSVPVTVASLPLPTGAATETTLAALNAKLPAAAAAGDALANPTVSIIGDAQFQFNGTSWDRMRNNAPVALADTGVKTASFNGATQTNYNARGVILTVVLGAVSGTTPTLTIQPQFSVDGGTTWWNMGPALTNLTLSAQNLLLMIYPTNISQAAGATPANLTSVGATVVAALNFPLPRHWRLVYTIAGTTPSFNISGVNANYIL